MLYLSPSVTGYRVIIVQALFAALVLSFVVCNSQCIASSGIVMGRGGDTHHGEVTEARASSSPHGSPQRCLTSAITPHISHHASHQPSCLTSAITPHISHHTSHHRHRISHCRRRCAAEVRHKTPQIHQHHAHASVTSAPSHHYTIPSSASSSSWDAMPLGSSIARVKHDAQGCASW